MKISVSILNEKNNYESAIKKLNNTKCDYLHLDIMDGTFTESSSFTYDESKEIKELCNKKLDIHIMSNNLDDMIDKYLLLDPEYITFHIEVDNLDKYINKIKEKNKKVGIAINPDTDINNIYKYLDKIDLVLVMSVFPGKSGQKFITDIISKLKELKELQYKYNYLIEVDGGINNHTIDFVKDYVDIIVSGSYITNSDNYEEKINSLLM